MANLLKDAIADAKAVRATALENAKDILKEAFTPRLNAMISHKLKSEAMDDESDDKTELEESSEQDDTEWKKKESEGTLPKTNTPDPQGADNDINVTPEDKDLTPTLSEDEFSDEESAEDNELDEIIRELESDTDFSDDASTGDFGGEETDSSDFGGGEEDGSLEGEEDTTPQVDVSLNPEGNTASVTITAPAVPVATAEENPDETGLDDTDSDVTEVVATLESEQNSDDLAKDNFGLRKENKEYRKAVTFLRSKLNEVNLLNAKLLYTNKLFRSHTLSTPQKMKIVESFDLTKTIRETKMTFAILSDALTMGGLKKKSINESVNAGSSKAVKSTAPSPKQTEVLKEGSEMVSRFQHLAGIKVPKVL